MLRTAAQALVCAQPRLPPQKLHSLLWGILHLISSTWVLWVDHCWEISHLIGAVLLVSEAKMWQFTPPIFSPGKLAPQTETEPALRHLPAAIALGLVQKSQGQVHRSQASSHLLLTYFCSRPTRIPARPGAGIFLASSRAMRLTGRRGFSTLVVHVLYGHLVAACTLGL